MGSDNPTSTDADSDRTSSWACAIVIGALLLVSVRSYGSGAGVPETSKQPVYLRAQSASGSLARAEPPALPALLPPAGVPAPAPAAPAAQAAESADSDSGHAVEGVHACR